MRTTFAVLVASGAIAGCAVGPQYQRPKVASPERHAGAVSADPTSLADAPWWGVFEDPALRSLIEEAVASGHDATLAAWRVDEARAAAGIARAGHFPQVQATAGWSKSRQSGFVSPFSDPLELADVNLGLSWELDLWGRIRRLDEAALARFLASEEARRGVLLSLVSEVASGYFRLRALDARLEIARRTAAAFDDTREVFADRLEAGLASSLETASASASLAATAAAIPELESQIAAQENALSVLLGRHPGAVARGAALVDQPLPPEIPAGLPADLLERRPDIRQAEQELRAANAEVGVAVADLFPRISLTGAFGGVAPEVSDLLGDGRAWSAGGGLLSPIFQGKRLQDRHRAAVARWEQARVRYEQSVTRAFGEVATALVAYRRLAEVEAEQARAVTAYREAVELSGIRYLTGLSDYLEVLQAQQQLFPAENALVGARFERLATLVRLYRALGGGWRLDASGWARSAEVPAED